MSEMIKDSNFDLALLNHQDIRPLMEHVEQLKEIMQRKSPDNCIDAYLLGYMHGKRAERAKKAKQTAEENRTIAAKALSPYNERQKTEYQLVIKESPEKEEIKRVLVYRK